MKQPFYLKGEETLEKKMAQTCAYELTKCLLRMVGVLCPFVAEEFFEQTTMNAEFKSVFLLKESEYYFNNKYDWDLAVELRSLMNQHLEPMQQQKLVKGSSQLFCNFKVSKEKFDKLTKLKSVMSYQYWLGVSEMSEEVSEVMGVELLNLQNNEDYQKCPRCWNYDKKLSFVGEVCHHCENDA